MADQSDDQPGGRGRPPKHTRWKTKESGNSKRQYTRRKLSAPELIERELAELIKITSPDGDRKVSKLEAILLQLNKNLLSGNRQALTVLMKFETLASQKSKHKVQLDYIDNAYSQAVSRAKKEE